LGQSNLSVEQAIDEILGSFSLDSEWVTDIADMHTKFGVNDVIRSLPADKLRTFMTFRLNFLQEELDEAKEALASGDASRAEDVVDAMIDLCVVAIGTLNAFDVDADEAWERVFEKNMLKEPGVNPNRPNPLGLPDMIKPAGWTAPTHADNTGFIGRVFEA
jgi:predicted HAD superfamily Cof-like phosphohydrolase